MDTDTANPRRLIQKKVYHIIDMAVVDIFNSKKKYGKLDCLESSTSFVNDVKSAWLKLNDEERSYLTKVIKNTNSNKKKTHYNISYYDLVDYFAKYIIPYNNQTAQIVEKKSFTQMLIWANRVKKSLDKIKQLDKELRMQSLRKSTFAFEKINDDYEFALNEFYSVYGEPSKGEKRILKLKLLFDNNQDLLEHLLNERTQWNEILSTVSIS